MRLLHLSDSHGSFIQLPSLRGVDAVVHSGDFLPNKTRGNLQTEPAYQLNWLHRYKDVLQAWMPSPMPFLFCRGNHDFMDPVPVLQSFGINAIDITNKFVEVSGVGFYGFPYIPRIAGEWFGELEMRPMQKELETLVRVLDSLLRPDVLVCHGPMYNVLDLAGGERCGSKDLAHAVFSVAKHFPKHFLCGHIHESHGQSFMERESGERMHVSNAATTFHVFEVLDSVGVKERALE
jgi:Icc-related predicted phosphoesterase